jgi:uncharacterized membrane protein
MARFGKVLGVVGPGLDTPARAGLLAAAVSVGASFQRGLMPRSSLNQAIITGASAAANFGVTTILESVLQSATFAVAGDSADHAARSRRRGLLLAGNLVAIGGGVAAARLLSQRKDEPVRRAVLRTTGQKMAEAGLAGSIVLLSLEGMSRIDSSRDDDVFEYVPIALPLGSAIAAAVIWQQRRAQSQAGVEDAFGQQVEQDASVSVARAVPLGAGIMVVLVGLAQAERALAGGVAAGVSAVAPGLAPYGRLAGHVLALGGLAVGARYGLDAVYQKTEQGGKALEAAYASPPTSEFVSGGPRSDVDWDTIGREGRRFVNMALSRDDIASVMGEAVADPIRAYVGKYTVEDQTPASADVAADLAIRELDRFGAFERPVLCFFSPTGSGYANYVALETLEYLTRGNCASVSLQYSVRPSFLSLGRTALGEAQVRSFFNALHWRLSTIPEEQRPRLLLFGESLGAWTGQDAFLGQGVGGYERLGIDRVLFIGTPWESKWHQALVSHPELVDPQGRVVTVATPAEWMELPEDVRERNLVTLLANTNDPIPKFSAQIIVQQPDWMGPRETRPVGVPRETFWRPVVTFMITVSDLMNAMNMSPGEFVATGHDYRKSLGRMTQQVFRLDATDDEMARVEEALRRRELQFAQRRLVDETLAKSEEKIKAQLAKWGADTDNLPPLVAAPAG